MRFFKFKNFIILITTIFIIIGGLFIFFYFYSGDDKKSQIKKDGEIESGAYLFNIKIEGLDLNVELADTAEKRLLGLSGRIGLKENQGMLFVFDYLGFYSFWMKDMSFPIDVIWIGEDLKITDITENISPITYPRKFQSNQMARYVLEVNAGWVLRHKIEIGMSVSLDSIFSELKIKEQAITELIGEEAPISPNVLELESVSAELQRGEPEFRDQGATNITEQNLLINQGQREVVLLDAPFTSQAPFGGWSDPRRENACEEASAIMAMAWARGEKLTAEYADKKILEISEYELKVYGDFYDTSAEDTVKRIFNDYFKYEKVKVVYDIGAEDIKKELQNGNLVIVSVHGQKVKNPYYTPPGPIEHMIVVVGYDSVKKEFITNDPGTRHGEGYRYKEDVFESALQDYPTGQHLPITGIKTAMIVVSKQTFKDL